MKNEFKTLPSCRTEVACVAYTRNVWPTLIRYLNDARSALNNGAAERDMRPLVIGRGNWLHVGGDGGLKTASVLLSVCASTIRHRLHPWVYLRDVLDHLAVRSAGADLLPDAQSETNSLIRQPAASETANPLTAIRGGGSFRPYFDRLFRRRTTSAQPFGWRGGRTPASQVRPVVQARN